MSTERIVAALNLQTSKRMFEAGDSYKGIELIRRKLEIVKEALDSLGLHCVATELDDVRGDIRRDLREVVE